MYAEVQEVQTLSPNLVRVVLTGGTLDHYEQPDATDTYINAQFVPRDSPLVVPFDTADLDDLAPEHRPKPRRFTVRRWEPERQALSIDFVTHGDEGYAGSWAKRAVPGDRLQFKGPGGSYRPSPDVDWHLFVGDESALGAIGASVESLPAGSRAMVFVVIDEPSQQIELPSEAEVTLTWLHRFTAADPAALLPDAVASAEFPDGTFDVFVHGEAGEVREVRRHLLTDRGVDPATASISPYWRRRHTDEDWRRTKRDWMAQQAADV